MSLTKTTPELGLSQRRLVQYPTRYFQSCLLTCTAEYKTWEQNSVACPMQPPTKWNQKTLGLLDPLILLDCMSTYLEPSCKAEGQVLYNQGLGPISTEEKQIHWWGPHMRDMYSGSVTSMQPISHGCQLCLLHECEYTVSRLTRPYNNYRLRGLLGLWTRAADSWASSVAPASLS